jgi:hypothetical protein
MPTAMGLLQTAVRSMSLDRRVTSQTRRKKIRENVHKIYFMNVFANPLVNGFVASLGFFVNSV